MEASLTPLLNRYLLRDVIANAYTSYKIQLEPVTDKVDNYLAVLYRVQIHTTRQDGSTGNLNLIVKCALTDPTHAIANSKRLFEHELNIYTKIIPAFNNLALDRGITNAYLSAIPKCFGGSVAEGDEMIVLEDMKFRGFLMHDRTTPLDYEHCRLVVRFLGRLHGYSIGLRKKHPETYTMLTKNFTEAIFTEEENFVDYIEPALQSCVSLLTDTKDVGVIASLKDSRKFKQDMIDVCRNKFTSEFLVIGHGDCWTNNYLFRYEDHSSTPLEVCAIDFQMARHCSPAVDLAYFFATSTDKSLRDTHYDQLLCEYHGSLGEMAAELGIANADGFTFEHLQRHLRANAKVGLGFAVCLLKTMISDGTDATPLVTQLHTREAFSTRDVAFNTRIRDLMRFFYDRNYL